VALAVAPSARKKTTSILALAAREAAVIRVTVWSFNPETNRGRSCQEDYHYSLHKPSGEADCCPVDHEYFWDVTPVKANAVLGIRPASSAM
jgi:hypothetical protein